MASFTEPIRISRKSELLKLEKTPFTSDAGETLMRYNLQGANLQGAFLRSADLEGADLRDADLRDADLIGADLKDADLRDADLEYANLEDADLRDAVLRSAVLRSANLTNANLEYANLQGAVLTNVYLRDAVLTNLHSPGANLEGAHLEGAHLERANLTNANLTNANLTNAHLERAVLTNANLTNANLTNAHLEDANFEGANFEGANFEGANFGFVDDTPPAGVAYEVHRKSHELESNDKFLNTIGVNESPRLASFNYNEIQTKFVNFINGENNFKNSDKNKLIENFTMVINRAKSCGTPTSDEANMLNKSIVFAFQQDSRFTEAYIDIFIDETFKAYDSGTDQLSCVAGIKERFYTSLLAAALQVDTIEGFVKTPKLITLLCMAKTGKVQKDPNEILQKWAESWEGKDDKWKKMQNEKRKEHFKNYMMEEYKKDDCYEKNQESIKNTINAKATEIDYVFQNNEEAAQFGGRKRKNKRSLKKRGKPMKNKTKTKTKRITRKAKQNKKKRITRKAKQSKKKRSVRK